MSAPPLYAHVRPRDDTLSIGTSGAASGIMEFHVTAQDTVSQLSKVEAACLVAEEGCTLAAIGNVKVYFPSPPQRGRLRQAPESAVVIKARESTSTIRA
jgi:hypothetical protein